MTKRGEVRELRDTIEELTGKPPVSYDVTYLRRRLAMLRRPRITTTVPTDVAPWTIVIDLQTRARAELVASIGRESSLSTEAIVLRAIDEYAVKLGHGVDVERAKAARWKATR